MIKRMGLGLLALALLVPATSAAPQEEKGGKKTELKWNLKEGAKDRYEFSNTVDFDIGGLELEMTMGYGFQQEVTKVNKDGSATVKWTIDRTKLAMSGMMGESDYDSAEGDDAEDPAGQILQNLLKGSFHVGLTKAGQVDKVEGFSKLVEAAIEKIDDEEGDMVIEYVKAMLNDNYMKMLLQQAFPALPAEPVKQGASWKNSNTATVAMMGDLTLKTEAKLDEVAEDGKTAKIEQNTKISFEVDEDSEGAMMEFKSGATKTEILWNVEHGRPESVKATTEIKVLMAEEEYTVEMKASVKHAPKEEKKEEKSEEDRDE